MRENTYKASFTKVTVKDDGDIEEEKISVEVKTDKTKKEIRGFLTNDFIEEENTYLRELTLRDYTKGGGIDIPQKQRVY